MYHFEGDYKSSPVQNYSGTRRPSGKAELLDRAQREREKRQSARLREKRVVFVQSRFRGFSTRKRLREYFKQEFLSHIENAENLTLLSRLLYFVDDESCVLKLTTLLRENLNVLGPDWIWRLKNLVVRSLFPDGFHHVDFFTEENNLKTIFGDDSRRITHEILTYAVGRNYFETFFKFLPTDFSLKMILKPFPTNSDVVYTKFYENLNLADRKTVKKIMENIKNFDADKFNEKINKRNPNILFFILHMDQEKLSNFFKSVAFLSQDVDDEISKEFNTKKNSLKWSQYLEKIPEEDFYNFLTCLHNFKFQIPYMNALYEIARNGVSMFKIWNFIKKQKRDNISVLNLIINNIHLENDEIKILPCISILAILLQIYCLDNKFDLIHPKILLEITLGIVSFAYNEVHKVKNEDLWSDALLQLVAALSLMEPASNLRLSSVKIYDSNSIVINEPFKKRKSEDGFYVLSAQENRTYFILNSIPFAVNFRQRFSYLQNFFDSLKLDRDFPNRFVRIRRDFIYEDAFKGFENEDLRSNIKIQMVNSYGLDEAGVDGGGIFREFISKLLKTAFHPERNFFKYNSDNELYPNPHQNARHFKFIGKILAKAIFEGILVELRFAECLLSKITEKKNNLYCLKSLDGQIYKNVVNLLHSDLSNLGLDFTLFKDGCSHELKPGGSRIQVDENNVAEYVNLVADFMTDFKLEPFLDGISEIFPSNCLKMFTPKELQMIISGDENPIDIEDMRLFTVYSGGFHPDDPTVVLFWEVVRNFTDEEKGQLLRFITSYSRPPLLGFAEIRPPLCIQKAEGRDGRFPTSSTCMHLLKLPNFSNAKTLRDKLLYAIQSGTGFELS